MGRALSSLQYHMWENWDRRFSDSFPIWVDCSRKQKEINIKLERTYSMTAKSRAFSRFPSDSVVENLPASAGDTGDKGLILGLGRSPWRRDGNQLQYSCLENPVQRGGWWATVHEVAKSWTWLSDWTLIHTRAFSNLSCKPDSVTSQLCEHGQVIQLLWLSFSSCKMRVVLISVPVLLHWKQSRKVI